MGRFDRGGEFTNREKFLGALKAKLEKLRNGKLAGLQESWAKEGDKDVGTLGGMFGVKVVFTVAAKDWRCEASLPSFLPVPQSMVEEMFDKEFADLKGL